MTLESGLSSMNEGVWRTISGRRVFIKNGQSMAEAMSESGKFKSREEKGKLGQEYRDKLKNIQGKSDGTYDLDTGEKVNFGNEGYNVSFEQSSDDYTNSEYYDKIYECRNKCDGRVYGGVFGGDPEISFYTKDKKVALALMKKYNQHSIWDNSLGDIIENDRYDEKKNRTNYKG